MCDIQHHKIAICLASHFLCIGKQSLLYLPCLILTSDEIAASTGYIGNEKHHCDDCLLQNEQHKNLAAMESQSLKTKAQQVKVTQVVSTNASRVYSCTETVQPKEYQVMKS